MGGGAKGGEGQGGKEPVEIRAAGIANSARVVPPDPGTERETMDHGCDAPTHLRPLRRPDGSVQIGLGPRSIRLLGLTDAEHRWLAGIDPLRGLSAAVTAATLERIDPARATEVLDRLVTGGLLLPSASAQVDVAVVGFGALPSLLVDALRQNAHVRTHRVRPGGEPDVTVDLAIVISTRPPSPELVRPWLAAEVPVLPLWCLTEQVSIGPLLRPDGGPCLQCLDLTRTNADPAWPWLRAQLTRNGVGGSEAVDEAPSMRLLAAGLTTAVALDHLAGRLRAPETSFEVATPGPTLERHSWPVHPGCEECSGPALRMVPTPTDEGGCSADSGWTDTMAG